MNNNFFTYVINLRDQMSGTLRRIGGSIVDTSNKVRHLRDDVSKLDKTPLNNLLGSFKTALPYIGMFAGALTTGAVLALKNCADSYNVVQAAQDQMTISLQKSIGARQSDVDAIMRHINAQQKLGVISSALQVSAITELSSYVSQKNSIDTLLPSLNDLIAKKYGLKATDSQAVSTGKALGQALRGQTSALENYGIMLTDSQKKLLKTGSETKRIALLNSVLTKSFAGVNKQLALTPEGKKLQIDFDSTDINNRIGKVVANAQNAFNPFYEHLNKLKDRIASFFERNATHIQTVMQVASTVAIRAVDLLTASLVKLKNIMSSVIAFVDRYGLVIGALVTVLGTFAAVMGVITLATKAWAVAKAILNVILTLNPVGLIIAGVVALIALIAFLIIKIDGWGETWDNVLNMCKLGFETFKTAVTLIWLKVQDSFLRGFEVIEKGWYKVQSLWDKDAAKAGLDKLAGERNDRATKIAKTKDKLDELTKLMSDMEVLKLKGNNTSLVDMTKKYTSKLGISSPGIPGMLSLGGNSVTGSGGSGNKTSSKTANNITTGGSKTTNITLNLGNLIQTMTVNTGDIKEGAEKIRDIVQDEMNRALAYTAANI